MNGVATPPFDATTAAVARPAAAPGVRSGALARAAYALAAAAALAVVFAAAWRRLFAFGLDEAMLLLALREVRGLGDLLRPLPLYDQASPLGFELAGLAVLRVTGAVAAQKVLPLVASVAALGAVAAAAWRRHRSAPAAAFATALLLASGVFAFVFGNYKHYVFETCALALLALAFAWPARRRALVVAAGLVALCFTNATPMLVAALGAAALLARGPGEDRWGEDRWAGDRRFLLVTAAVLAVLFGGLYLAATRPAAALQFVNYGHVYERGFAASPGALVRNVRVALMSIQPELPIAADVQWNVKRLCAVVFAVGFVAGLVRRRAEALALAAVLALVGALSVVRLYPVLPDRHASYLLPLVALLTTEGAALLLGVAARLAGRAGGRPDGAASRQTAVWQLARVAAVWGALAVGLHAFWRTSAAHASGGALATPHVAAATASGPGRLVVPLFYAQPAVQLARAAAGVPGTRFLEVDARSARALAPAAWRAGDDRAFATPGIWGALLTAEQSALGWTPERIPLDGYFAWVARRAAGAPEVAFVVPRCAPHLDRQIDAFLSAQAAEAGAPLAVLHESACLRTVLLRRRAPRSPGAA